MIKLFHVITDLDTGGAEKMLYKLLTRTDRSRFEPQVISLTDVGVVGEEIQKLDVPVRGLGMKHGVPNPMGVLRLAGWLRRERPHLIQTWMYHGDLVGGAAAMLARGIPTVWNLRHTNLDPRSNKGSMLRLVRLGARLSPWLPTRIVCCSEATRRAHATVGYAENRMIVIPNGFDLGSFRPEPEARVVVRKELGVPHGAPMIGLIGRFHPEKDHKNFVEAANRISARVPHVHYLLCGDGVTWDNAELARWIGSSEEQDRWHLLGLRRDVPRLNAALDIAVSSSVGEGFANVLGEAMACEVPCVVTDVGDSAWIVGETGKVVPPRDPRALADACVELLEMDADERHRLGAAARVRVREQFDLGTIAARYEQLYLELIA